LPSALRRHQPREGGAGVHPVHPAGCPVAGLRLGRAQVPCLGLLRAALRLCRGADPPWEGLRGRRLGRGDPPAPRDL